MYDKRCISVHPRACGEQGVQLGQDVHAWRDDAGDYNAWGVLLGFGRASGDVAGTALARDGIHVGSTEIDRKDIGLYHTQISDDAWYTDTVLIYSRLSGDARSSLGEAFSLDGHAAVASVEGGYTLKTQNSWNIEPQAQLIYQHLSLDDTADSFAQIGFRSDDLLTARLGLRVYDNRPRETGKARFYGMGNIWHNFDADQTILFNGTGVTTVFGGTSVEIGLGAEYMFSETSNGYFSVEYMKETGGDGSDAMSANLGISLKF